MSETRYAFVELVDRDASRPQLLVQHVTAKGRPLCMTCGKLIPATYRYAEAAERKGRVPRFHSDECARVWAEEWADRLGTEAAVVRKFTGAAEG